MNTACFTTTAFPPSHSKIEEKRRHPALCLGLLRVNLVIHAEAEPDLYQCNTVVLPRAPLTALFFRDCLNSAQKRR